MGQPYSELTSLRPMGQKEGIAAGSKGQFLSALKDDFFRQFDQNQSIVN